MCRGMHSQGPPPPLLLRAEHRNDQCDAHPSSTVTHYHVRLRDLPCPPPRGAPVVYRSDLTTCFQVQSADTQPLSHLYCLCGSPVCIQCVCECLQFRLSQSSLALQLPCGRTMETMRHCVLCRQTP